MAVEESRMARLRLIVETEAKAAGGKLRAGYRAVATATGLKEEYIYQLYRGVKKTIGADAARAISRAYRHGQDEHWFDLPLTAPPESDSSFAGTANRKASQPSATIESLKAAASNGIGKEISLTVALARLAGSIAVADQQTRDDVLSMLTLYLRNPVLNAGQLPLIASRLEGEFPTPLKTAAAK